MQTGQTVSVIGKFRYTQAPGAWVPDVDCQHLGHIEGLGPLGLGLLGVVLVLEYGLLLLGRGTMFPWSFTLYIRSLDTLLYAPEGLLTYVLALRLFGECVGGGWLRLALDVGARADLSDA